MKKRIWILFLVLPLVLSACSKNGSTLTSVAETERSSNEALVTGQVVSRVGNDIDLAIGTLVDQGGMGAMPSGDMGSMPSRDMESMPSGDMESMPSGDMGSMPSGDTGSMPSGGPGQGGMQGQRPEDSSGAAGAAQNSGQAAGSRIQLTGETMALTIPVGTRVLVASGGTLTVSSFGRIQTDDILQLILKTQADGTQTVTLVQIME